MNSRHVHTPTHIFADQSVDGINYFAAEIVLNYYKQNIK